MEDNTRPARRCGARAFGTFVAASATALALYGGANGAHGAGFALKEQSAAAQGNAFAGATAGAEDVTYMFFNPAGLTRLDDHAAAVVVSYIIPHADISNASASTTAPFSAPITGSTNDGAVNALVPAFYAAYNYSEDLKFGLSINTPFGLTTDYDPGWIGRYHALESSLMTVNINPVVAYRVNERFSVGVGVQAEYADATLSNAIDFGTIGAANSVPGSNPGDPVDDGSSELTGDDWAFGFNLGFLFELSEATRFGLNYRSQIDHTLEGNVVFDTGTGVGPTVAGATGAFSNTGGQAALNLPQIVSAGVYHQINDKWAVMGEVSWTGWNSLDEIRVTFDNPSQPDSVITTDWEDVWYVALGATWQANEKWTLRGGIGYDQSPIPEETRSPRIPDSDRTWLSVGTKFQPRDNFTIDAGYTHIFFGDAPVNLTAAGENAFRGNLAFDTDISIDILTVQGTFRF